MQGMLKLGMLSSPLPWLLCLLPTILLRHPMSKKNWPLTILKSQLQTGPLSPKGMENPVKSNSDLWSFGEVQNTTKPAEKLSFLAKPQEGMEPRDGAMTLRQRALPNEKKRRCVGSCTKNPIGKKPKSNVLPKLVFFRHLSCLGRCKLKSARA